jgi:hypothetical protein
MAEAPAPRGYRVFMHTHYKTLIPKTSQMNPRYKAHNSLSFQIAITNQLTSVSYSFPLPLTSHQILYLL